MGMEYQSHNPGTGGKQPLPLSLMRQAMAEMMNNTPRMNQTEVLRVKLEVLRREHRDLDDAIDALQEKNSSDMLTLQRLKRKKLLLKDQITRIEIQITPDIIA